MNGRKYLKSQQAFLQAKRAIPGGVNSPVRAFGGVDQDPLFIASAAGAKIYDIDGNEYIDYVCSWGPMIVGHAHPKVIEAVNAAARKGTSFGAPTIAETVLAEKIVSAIGWVEKVRMTSSGTEAVMTAIRLARAYTCRDYIVKMTGCYHGHCDSMLVSAGSGLAEQSIPSSPGVPQSLVEKTISIPYNDIQAAEAVFKRHPGRIAGVIVEPVAANMGVVVPDPSYLQALARLCGDDAALLILDEVITGFRLNYGLAARLFGVEADIVCLGKIIGGGLPAAAVGGRAAIMDRLAPAGTVYQAGTLSGNPLAVAAAIATLDILRQEDCYTRLDNTGRILQNGIEAAARRAGVPLTINRIGSIMSCFFTDKPVKNLADVQKSDIGMFKRFFSGMLTEGIYLAPSAYEAMFISLAHSEIDIEKTIRAAQNVFKTLV